MNPLVSVIIPTYNRAHIIKETLDSVLVQTYTNWECVIVDDGSTDDTLDILEEYRNKDPRFVIVRKEKFQKQSASVSRNVGLFHAKGDYIQFLDSDDLIAHNKFEIQLAQLSKEDDFAIATCKWERFESIVQPIEFSKESEDYRSFDNSKDYFDLIGRISGFYPPHSFLINKKLINFSGYWNEDLSFNDDGEFFFRLILNSSKMLFSADTHVLYRMHSGDNISMLNTIDKAKSLINSWKIIEVLYRTKYPEDSRALYINRKKGSAHYEIKTRYPFLVKLNKHFFAEQIKADNFIRKNYRKLYKRIKNRLKIILNGGRD